MCIISTNLFCVLVEFRYEKLLGNVRKRCDNAIAKVDGLKEIECKIICEADKKCKFYSWDKTHQYQCRTYEECVKDENAEIIIYKRQGDYDIII